MNEKILALVKSKGHWGVAGVLAVCAGLVAGQVVTPEQIGVNDTVLEVMVAGVVGGAALGVKALVGKFLAKKGEEAAK